MIAPAPKDVLGVSVDTWNAIGSIATAAGVIAAGIAAWLAYRQLTHTQTARLDQSRPYVLAMFDPDLTKFGFLDLVIRNVGAGPARNVRITTDPPLARAQQTAYPTGLAESRLFTEPTALMPPGHEIRTFFDRASERQETDLPDAYQFTISYEDGYGNRWTETSSISYGHLMDLLLSETLTTHHVAYTTREIRDLLKRSPLLKGQVDVTTESREERTARLHAEAEERRAGLEQRRPSAQKPSENDEGADTH